ncbi:MAG TPA: O-antigen ligase family protein [Gemmatimonadaceae bacterium]|nr:O-antigen ligase family protein [Gemmatimonadaceae bacterium]
MASAVRALPFVPRRVPIVWGLSAFIWLLPVHILIIAVLFGALGWPGGLVRVIAAWKEMLIALLTAIAIVRFAIGAGPTITIRWLDLMVGGLIAVSFGYLMAANAWFDQGLPVLAQLYGFRDAAFVLLLYFVGRATPEAATSSRYLRALFVVGIITSGIAILERLLVTPEMLVLLGAARYLQDFIGAGVGASGNLYGLPDNYWTSLGSHLVTRAGSTYLSAQGFAIPFLLIMPAATLFVTTPDRTRSRLAWLGYAVTWVGLLLTLTRMTILACLLQTIIILSMRRRWSTLVRSAVMAVLVSCVALIALPGLAAFAWDTVTWQTGSSVSHLHDWREGLENFSRYPLGVGLGAADIIAWRFGITPLAGDNQYLRFAVELGIVGLGLHLAILAGAITTGANAWSRARLQPVRDTGLLVALTALGIAMNAWTAGVFNATLLTYVFFWLLGSVSTASAEPAHARVST